MNDSHFDTTTFVILSGRRSRKFKIKYFLKKKTYKEIKTKIAEVYGVSVSSLSNMKYWTSEFSLGRTSIFDKNIISIKCTAVTTLKKNKYWHLWKKKPLLSG